MLHPEGVRDEARLGVQSPKTRNRAHAHFEDRIIMGEQDHRDRPKRRPYSMILLFVIVFVGSGVLLSLSTYTWYVHEDKGRLVLANRHLAQRLRDAETAIQLLKSDLRALELNRDLLINAAKLAPAPPGPEPQERDTRTVSQETAGGERVRALGLKSRNVGALAGVGLYTEGWTADNADIVGVHQDGGTGRLWYVGRDESWYVVSRTSHQRLQANILLFLASHEASNSIVGAAAARVLALSKQDAVNTLDHVLREVHSLANAHASASGVGIGDDGFSGGVQDVLVRTFSSPLLRHVCSTRYGIGLSAAAALITNPDIHLRVWEDSEGIGYAEVTRKLLYALFPGRLSLAASPREEPAGADTGTVDTCDMLLLEAFNAGSVEEVRLLRKLELAGAGTVVAATFPQADAWTALNLSSPQAASWEEAVTQGLLREHACFDSRSSRVLRTSNPPAVCIGSVA